MSEFTALTLQS